ncbi:hypothetical protein M8818_005263 [Zalaria obscura]|uniref:Uncharacterized protein n=1 Tax=Zalaria obscura TaxID=2024903 RepID=A0ACC3S9A9_9PEZI
MVTEAEPLVHHHVELLAPHTRIQSERAEEHSRQKPTTSGGGAGLAPPFVHQEESLAPCNGQTAKGIIPRLSATITDLVDEPLFHGHMYLSEEEAPSPVDSVDTMSLGSDNDALEQNMDVDVDSDCSDIETYTIEEQPCTRAQAVFLRSAGRAKVIEVPSSPIHSRRAANSLLSPLQTSVSHLSRNTSGSTTSYPVSRSSSTTTHTSTSTSDTRPATYRPTGSPPPSIQSPTTPLLDEGALTPTSITSPLTPNTPHTPTYFDVAAANSDSPTRTLASTSTLPKSLQAKTRSPYRLRLPSMIKRASTSFPNLEMPSQRHVSVPLSSRASIAAPAVYKPRMVPRGANEREPTLELPPSPVEEMGMSAGVATGTAMSKDVDMGMGMGMGMEWDFEVMMMEKRRVGLDKGKGRKGKESKAGPGLECMRMRLLELLLYLTMLRILDMTMDGFGLDWIGGKEWGCDRA